MLAQHIDFAGICVQLSENTAAVLPLLSQIDHEVFRASSFIDLHFNRISVLVHRAPWKHLLESSQFHPDLEAVMNCLRDPSPQSSTTVHTILHQTFDTPAGVVDVGGISDDTVVFLNIRMLANASRHIPFSQLINQYGPLHLYPTTHACPRCQSLKFPVISLPGYGPLVTVASVIKDGFASSIFVHFYH